VESVLVPILVLALLAAVVWVVSQPLRQGERPAEDADAAQRAELEAEKEAKYREIRDAELDHRTGKLDDADYRSLVGPLRRAAASALRAIDREERYGSQMTAFETPEVPPEPAPPPDEGTPPTPEPVPEPYPPPDEVTVPRPPQE
jgi:hypothetical protein